MRGTWYYDGSWIPLEIEHSKVIEEVHLKLFQKESNNQSISTCDTNVPQSYKGTLCVIFIFMIFLNLCNVHACRFNTKTFLIVFSVLHTEQFPEFHVDWHSVNDVTLYSEYTPTKLMRSVTSKLGFAKSKFRINNNKNIEIIRIFKYYNTCFSMLN